jgi:hypothetical protein
LKGRPLTCPARSSNDDLALESVTEWVETSITAAPNGDLLEAQLQAIKTDDAMIHFLHRFVLFNDALAARVPFLAGLIHLTPNLFLDPEPDVDFCRQANGRIAAFVAEAANDEYRMTAERNLVHQYLSQLFFRGVLEHWHVDGPTFDRQYPLPLPLTELLAEARDSYFRDRAPSEIFAALGFHVGLEFFAHQEFNLVDQYLRARHPALVDNLEQRGTDGPAYLWLATHTVVEIGHYRAGLEALKAAVKYCHPRDEAPRMLARIKEGFNGFIDLQKRYYESVSLDLG